MAENKRQNSRLKRWQKDYQIVVMEPDTLKKIRSLTTSKLSVGIIFFVVATSIIVASILAISFTPLRTFIPGYGQIEASPEFLQMTDKIVELESLLEEQNTYIDGLKNMLNGVEAEVEGIEKIEPEAAAAGTKPSNDQSTAIALYQKTLIAPIKGEVSAAFDYETAHYGIDILGAADMPIKSVDSGVVITSNYTMNHGYVISVQHDDNLISVYKHNSKILKKKGDRVKQGEAIAIIGNTGILTDGPHLHFELWYQQNPINPLTFVSL